ncbi:MAG: hypothetical protein PWP51_1115 [Clostridiales bacterium]|jgi:hypothetical protein|nr:hypothetical protein [Clostridiales bacterium]
MRHFIDVAHHSLNKHGEELCGDKVEILKTEDRTIIVLADGLGSGVKANILATLTTKIVMTMLRSGAELDDTIDTIINTLPVCSVRKIGYATFSIIEIDSKLNCRMIEFDNPPIFFMRKQQLVALEKTEIILSGKKLKRSQMKLEVGDTLVLCSDGVIHAGVGVLLNHGWEWSHVAAYLEEQLHHSSEYLNRRLIDTCNKLYDQSPGDDTTAVTVMIREPQYVNVLAGPPIAPREDKAIVDRFMCSMGKHVVCGGTAANIVARELHTTVETTLEYCDPNIPPIGFIKGVDLVTEGVLTLKMLLSKLKMINRTCEEPDLSKKDGVTRLLKLFIEDATHIEFWVGHAINPAHQNPDFPKDLGIKINVVKELIEELSTMGKQARMLFIDGDFSNQREA